MALDSDLLTIHEEKNNFETKQIYKSEAIQVIEIGEVLQLGWYLTDNVQGVDFSAQANMPKYLRDKRRKRYEFVRACINQTGNLVSFQNQMSMT